VDWLIVGLGNPGPQYDRTPHNVGFAVVGELARRWELAKGKDRFSGRFAEGRTMPGGPRVALLQPQTWMNDAGRSVGPARGALKLELDHVLVVHDDIDLAFGQVRTRLGGGLGGHNGLRSTRKALGSPDFGRIRVGVGRPGPGDPTEVADYVLGKWRQSPSEVEALIDDAARAVERIVDGAPLD
jgi:peptidyl-tRNA hydrolase, PTH1 family